MLWEGEDKKNKAEETVMLFEQTQGPRNCTYVVFEHAVTFVCRYVQPIK